MSGKGHSITFTFNTPANANSAYQKALKNFRGTALNHHLSVNTCTITLLYTHLINYPRIASFVKRQKGFTSSN